MKPHMVWWKFPLCDAEVKARFDTRAEADELAARLEAQYAGGVAFGRVAVWVESPGTIEARLRQLHEEYEEGR